MIIVAVEGDTDLPVARKLVADSGLDIALEIDCNGKSRIDRDLIGFNNAAKGSPWLVIRDLNHDADCPPAFLEGQRFRATTWMCFRLAVREMEAWLLADAVAFAKFFDVPEDLLPDDPDGEDDPTATIIRLVRSSRSAQLRKAMLPPPGFHSVVGPLYEAKIIEFGGDRWSLARAAKRSRSLREARLALRRMARRWTRHVSGR